MTKWHYEQLKEHRKEWIKALRSGKYKQGKGVLRDKDNQYCCLGVACEVAGISPSKTDKKHDYEYEHEDMYPPEDVLDYFGLNDCTGTYHNMNARNLVGDNDECNYSFNEIADIIESEPEGLFE